MVFYFFYLLINVISFICLLGELRFREVKNLVLVYIGGRGEFDVFFISFKMDLCGSYRVGFYFCFLELGFKRVFLYFFVV